MTLTKKTHCISVNSAIVYTLRIEFTVLRKSSLDKDVSLVG